MARHSPTPLNSDKANCECTADYVPVGSPRLKYCGYLENGEAEGFKDSTKYGSVSGTAPILITSALDGLSLVTTVIARTRLLLNPVLVVSQLPLPVPSPRIRGTSLKRQCLLALTFAEPADNDKALVLTDSLGLEIIAPGKNLALR